MQATRQRDTAPELALRRELHRRGLRYLVHAVIEGLPRRRLDVVFPRARLAVAVHGCFWHACPEHASSARSNSAFWQAKLAANVRRDHDTADRLAALGWTYLVVWEHQDAGAAANHIEGVYRRLVETS